MDDNTFNLPVELERVSVPAESAFAVFSAPDTSKIDPILAQVRGVIDDFLPRRNLKTAAGRKEIASVAHKVARAKTAIEEAGKKVADEAKAIPKRIDANRKHVKDTLDAWRDEVRKPLDDWEAAEEARTSAHNLAIAKLIDAGRLPHGVTADQIEERIAAVEAVVVGPSCEEFESKYAEAKEAALAVLTPALDATKAREAEAAELARLRAEAAEREERERQERLAREAAEKAREDERRRAQEEIEARERAARAEVEAAEARAKAERESAERREREAREAAAAAERRAERAEQEARDKLAREEAERKAEEDRRAADREHRGRINSAAAKAFVEAGIDEAVAYNVVTAIAKGKIPNVTINY